MGVTFGLIATYAAPTPAADYTYLFAADQQPAGGPWIGAFAYAKAAQSAPSDQTLAQLVAQMGGGGPYQHVGILVLATAPDTTKNPNSLPNFRASLLQVTGIGAYGGVVLWLPALGSFTASAPQLAFQGVGSGAQGRYTLLPQAFPLLALGGSGRTLFMDGRNSRGPALAVGSDQSSLSLTFAAGASLPVSFGAAAPTTPAITATSVTLPLAGAQAGCLTASGAVAASGMAGFQLGVQYGIVSNKPLFPSGPMTFPLLDSTETFSGAAATLTIDPLGAGGGRSRLTLTPKSSLSSAYRTAINETVALTPQTGGGFAAMVGFNHTIYFAPSGPFALSVPGSTANGHALLCGLSGVEAITFTAGDLITFQASAAGCFSMNPSPTGGFSFTPSNVQPCAAAVATITAASATPCAYRCEPAQAPFFSPDDSSQPTLLTHDGFTLKTLPAKPAAAFPLIPFAAYTPAHVGPGAVSGLAQAFETAWAAPTRAATIQGYPAAQVTGGPALGITPQGYIAKFDGMGGITSLSLADAGGSVVSFGASSGSLPDWLRDALLSPQCFLVASCATADFQQYVDVTVAMSDWGFVTIPPLPSTTPSQPPPSGPIIAPGDYQSVLIVKSAQGTVVDLVSSPQLWNGCALLNDAGDPGNAYARLNDAATDPQGLMLSSWLSTYLAQALATWNNGTGPQGLEVFCELITDPDWCGFLCLNAPVNPGALPSDLDFLLAGVDPKQLMAHHLGCAANQVTYKSGYQQDSAFFGYVHYLRPGAPPGGAVSVPFVPSTLAYDFQLMRLEAVFENSALNSFSSMALLLVDTLFGDPVLPSASGPGPVATNAVIIDGVLQHHDGVGTYVFTTPVGMAATFYLSSQALDRTEIDRAIVVQNPSGTVNGPSNPNRSAVTFQLAGWLGLLSAPIDLLSYAALPFSNLSLRMEFDKADGGNKQFAMDLSALALTPLADAQVDSKAVVNAAMASANVLYRSNSLVASFPLRLTNFITNGTQSPSSMGFLPLPVKNASGSTGGDGSLDASQPWSALQLDLPLGGSGSLDASGLIDATLLFAWTPGEGSGQAAIAPFIKITGPGGADLSFNLEGIIKFGAKGIILSQAPDATGNQVFVLEFAGIGLTLFTKSFPPGGSTNLLVAGSANRTVGWFGAYVDPTAPPLGSGPSMGSLTSGGTV